MAKSFKFRYVNEITGAFVLLVVALLVGAVVLMGLSQRWFTKMQTITLELNEEGEGAMGLKPGAEVLILGASVGSVREIGPDADGRMVAIVSVRSDAVRRYVRRNSVVQVRKTLGFGDAYIEIARGTSDPLAPGDKLEAFPDRGPTELLEKTIADIRNEIIPAVREARLGFEEYKHLAADLRSPESNLQQALAHLSKIAASVERGEGLAGKVLSDPKMAAQVEDTLPKVNRSLDEVQGILADVRKTTGTLAGQGGQTLEQVQGVLTDVRKTTAALPDTVAGINRTAESLPGLVLQMQETLRQIQRLVEGMQRSWLLRGAMDEDAAGGRIPPEGVGGGR